MITAIVLAGGASSRFGGDKLAAELGEAPVLHHTLRAVGPVAGEIVLVLAPDAAAPALPDELAGRIVIARDTEAGGGPLAGVASALAAVRWDASDIALVVGGDMPHLVPAVLRRLADRLEAEKGLGAITLDASPPAPLPMAIRPVAVRPVAQACLAGGRRSLRALLDAVGAATVPAADWRALDPDAATLRDIDTPQDLAR